MKHPNICKKNSIVANQKSIPYQTDRLDMHENFILLKLINNFERIKYDMISETSYRGVMYSERVNNVGKYKSYQAERKPLVN